MYARDIDGTESLHPCASTDPGAIQLYDTAALAAALREGEIVGMREAAAIVGSMSDTAAAYVAINRAIQEKSK